MQSVFHFNIQRCFKSCGFSTVATILPVQVIVFSCTTDSGEHLSASFPLVEETLLAGWWLTMPR